MKPGYILNHVYTLEKVIGLKIKLNERREDRICSICFSLKNLYLSGQKNKVINSKILFKITNDKSNLITILSSNYSNQLLFQLFFFIVKNL